MERSPLPPRTPPWQKEGVMKVSFEQEDIQAIAKAVAQEVAKTSKPPVYNSAADDTVFTVKSLAKYLDVSESWVYKRTQFKEIPYYKVVSSLRFKKPEIDRWLEENCKTPAVNPLSGVLKVVK